MDVLLNDEACALNFPELTDEEIELLMLLFEGGFLEADEEEEEV